jgi:two-component system response regulator CpxR
MSPKVILNAGQDPTLLETRSIILRAAGYIVESASSVKQAVTRFLAGSFDGVILCQSIPVKDRERLTCLIRASGSLTPVVAVSERSSHCDSFVDVAIEQDPKKLLRGIGEVFVKLATISTRTATPKDNAIAKRAESKAWRKTILCVDDDPNLLAIRRRLLENAGYLVLTTNSGSEGLKVFSTGIVDAVILDYEMPIMNGGAVAAQMLRIKDDVPLILVSGSIILQEDLAQFNRFIPKGGPPNVLLSTIEEFLSADKQPLTGNKPHARSLREPPDPACLTNTARRNEPWTLHL